MKSYSETVSGGDVPEDKLITSSKDKFQDLFKGVWQMNMNQIDPMHFDPIYQLMHQSFPIVERRSYEKARELLLRPDYRILAISASEQHIAGFIAEWRLGDILFLEHLAIDPNLRGQGLGSQMMREYLGQTDRPVIIEVETPETDIAERRIHFYQRLGFILSSFGYVQPKMQRVQSDSIFLNIMTYPEAINEDMFIRIRNLIFAKVYYPQSPDKDLEDEK